MFMQVRFSMYMYRIRTVLFTVVPINMQYIIHYTLVRGPLTENKRIKGDHSKRDTSNVIVMLFNTYYLHLPSLPFLEPSQLLLLDSDHLQPFISLLPSFPFLSPTAARQVTKGTPCSTSELQLPTIPTIPRPYIQSLSFLGPRACPSQHSHQ